MPSITDGEIRKALKAVQESRRDITLKDGEGRGTGRLALAIRAMPRRVTSDWMVMQWRSEKLSEVKLGGYPRSGTGTFAFTQTFFGPTSEIFSCSATVRTGCVHTRS